MRIVFCGTPDYAVPSLERLAGNARRYEVVAVVSQPDRRKGRANAPTPPPVVEAARKLGFPADRILQPESINEPEALARLKALAPDVLCVIAYGGLLGREALALPRRSALNAHGSLLPRHRGASPIQAAILAGDAETGVTIMQMVRGLDKGPVLFRRALPISPDDDAGALHDRLAALSADCFSEALEQLAAGSAVFTPQDETQASYAAKLDKDSGRIDWTNGAAFLGRFVRAMNPWPGAWTSVSLPDGSQKLRVRVAEARVSGCCQTAGPGAGLASGSGQEVVILVGCGDGGLLAVRAVQPEGKRPMSMAEFLRGAGRRLASASRWGDR